MWAITYSDALSSFPVMLPVYSSKSSSAYAAGLYKPRLPSNDNVIAAVRNRFPDFHFEHSFIICSSIFLFFRNMKYIPRFLAAGYYTAAGTVTIPAVCHTTSAPPFSELAPETGIQLPLPFPVPAKSSCHIYINTAYR